VCNKNKDLVRGIHLRIIVSLLEDWVLQAGAERKLENPQITIAALISIIVLEGHRQDQGIKEVVVDQQPKG
jgi:hypothetical protein